MSAEMYRKMLDYHLTTNNMLWEQGIKSLSDPQFVAELPYSLGSIRDQTVHMASVDQRWLAGLRSEPVPDFLDPASYPDRLAVRALWDDVQAVAQTLAAGLTDEALVSDVAGILQGWEVLFHMINHGTDHRAQVLAMLHQLDVPTFPQDYFFYVRG